MEYDLKKIKAGLQAIADIVILLKEDLTAIDSKLGDGDMGSSMEKGAQALKTVIAELPDTTPLKDFFMKCAAAFNKAAPSTMGTLLSGGMMELAQHFAEMTVLREEDLILIPAILAAAIGRRGKSREGDKTILDALLPLAETLTARYQLTGNLQTAWLDAAAKAGRGMEGTRGMIAKTGRAKWLGERNKEYPDGGAYMCCRIVEDFPYPAMTVKSKLFSDAEIKS